MKKIIILLFLAMSFMSCDTLVNNVIDTFTEARYSGIQLADLHLDEEFNSLKEIGIFLKNNITWETGSHSTVQDPYETWYSKKGNCEDFSMLFADIAYFHLGVKVEIVCVTQDEMIRIMSESDIEKIELEEATELSRTVESGGIPNHTIVRYDGIVYEPQNGNTYSVDVRYSYSFDTVFSN